MNEVMVAIYAYFHDGEMPPEDKKSWEPDPPKQWWGPPENRQQRKPIMDDVPKHKPGWWE